MESCLNALSTESNRMTPQTKFLAIQPTSSQRLCTCLDVPAEVQATLVKRIVHGQGESWIGFPVVNHRDGRGRALVHGEIDQESLAIGRDGVLLFGGTK